LIRIAQSIGVPVPRTELITDKQQLGELAAKLEYPVVIKPRCSWWRTSDGWFFGGVEYACSAEELCEKYHRINSKIPQPLIQERIVGPGSGLFALFADGEAKALFAHRRIREKPPSGGVSVLRESIPLDERISRYSRRLLEAFDWHGVAMVEFKMDLRDNTPKLMELNGRFWGSLQLAIDAGVDFPDLLYRAVLGENLPPPAAYQVGIKTRWFLGDLDHLQIIWRRRDLALPAEYPWRMVTLWRFLKACSRGNRLEVWNKNDLRPAFKELRDYIAAYWRRLKGKSR